MDGPADRGDAVFRENDDTGALGLKVSEQIATYRIDLSEVLGDCGIVWAEPLDWKSVV